jgi:hypothetical protein
MAIGIRVNQLAAELGVPSHVILQKFREEGLGAKVPNHMSVLGLGLAETARAWFRDASESLQPHATRQQVKPQSDVPVERIESSNPSTSVSRLATDLGVAPGVIMAKCREKGLASKVGGPDVALTPVIAQRIRDWFTESTDGVGSTDGRAPRARRQKPNARLALLLRLERLVSDCYNGNIQNYGPGGEWESEGRSFEYPVTFVLPDGSKFDSKSNSAMGEHIRCDRPQERVVRSGHYILGANKMPVIQNLDRILSLLEREYGLRLDSEPTP